MAVPHRELVRSSSVTLKNVAKTFTTPAGETAFAVKDVNLAVEPGQLVTLLGPSGCGKTTTLRMLAGFETPSSGDIFIGPQKVTTVPPNKRDVGMVFQSYALFPHLSVYDNIAYGLAIKKVPKEQLASRVKKVIQLMHLDELQDRFPAQLSGGQQQRVALARSVVTEPRVLLFDEPLSNLDAKLREYMRDELRKLQQSLGITSLYVTHDQSEALAISDMVVIMNKGSVQQIGTPRDIYLHPQNRFVADFMGKANFLSAKVKEWRGTEAAIEWAGGVIRVETKRRMSEGQQVDCVVRPEFWTLDPSGEFEGRVVRTTYLGTHVEYEISIGSDIVTMYDYQHHVNGVSPQGERVRLRLRCEYITLI